MELNVKFKSNDNVQTSLKGDSVFNTSFSADGDFQTEIRSGKSIKTNFRSEESFKATFGGTGGGSIESDTYEGRYMVTPSHETQILSTKDLLMKNNVTINPIPSNYGLITWDGSVLTVT